MKKTTKLKAILWSVAFPGFGQLLNGHLIIGIMFILLELLKASFIPDWNQRELREIVRYRRRL